MDKAQEAQPLTKSNVHAKVSVGQIFNNFPLTNEHTKACIALFFVLAIDAWEMMIMVYLAPMIGPDFKLDDVVIGNLIGAIFIGMVIGGIAWGFITNKIGRKKTIIYSLVSYGVISLLSSISPNYPTLYGMRILSGVAAAGMLMTIFPYIEELLPVKVRGSFSVYLSIGWPVGNLLALNAATWLMPLGWRWILAISSLAALWSIVIFYLVPESPYWLAKTNQPLKARKVLQGLCQNKIKIPANFYTEKTIQGQWRDLFIRPTLWITLLQVTINFTYAWGYWGLQTWLPGLLQQRGLNLSQSYSFITVSVLFMIPGYILASFLTHRIGRKKVMVLFVSVAAMAGFAFANVTSLYALYISNLTLSFFSMGAWGVWNTWLGELYTTDIRVLGCSAGFTGQRLACITAPTMIGFLIGTGSSFNHTIMIINTFMIMTVILALFLPEKEGLVLE